MPENKILRTQKAVISTLKEVLAGGTEQEFEIYAFLHPVGQNYAYISLITKERQSAFLDKITVELGVSINQNTSKQVLEVLQKIEQALSLEAMLGKMGEFELIGAMSSQSSVCINKSGICEGTLRHHFLLETKPQALSF